MFERSNKNEMSYPSREIERILSYNLQPHEKITKIIALMKQSKAGMDAAAFHIVMSDVRGVKHGNP